MMVAQPDLYVEPLGDGRWCLKDCATRREIGLSFASRDDALLALSAATQPAAPVPVADSERWDTVPRSALHAMRLERDQLMAELAALRWVLADAAGWIGLYGPTQHSPGSTIPSGKTELLNALRAAYGTPWVNTPPSPEDSV